MYVAPTDVTREQAIENLERADRATIPQVVSDLSEWLGLGLTAIAGGVNRRVSSTNCVLQRRNPSGHPPYAPPGEPRT